MHWMRSSAASLIHSAKDRRFRITHGEDYSRFFRAIDADSGTTFVALSKERQVLGTLGVAVRDLQFPDGQCRRAAYLGDLKTAPGASRGRTLLRLGKDVTAWCLEHGAVVAYGIVMDGTDVLPPAYTGKLGIHSFQPVSRICVFRLPVGDAASGVGAEVSVTSDELDACFARLSAGASHRRVARRNCVLASPPLSLRAADIPPAASWRTRDWRSA